MQNNKYIIAQIVYHYWPYAMKNTKSINIGLKYQYNAFDQQYAYYSLKSRFYIK